ncbi:MAG TPA: hypothetical protein V6D37_00280 [Candidatus Sericytochromatia bacterium]|jgi:hypothetical protein
MKTFKYWTVVPAALVMLLSSVGVVLAQPMQITPGFQPDPLTVTGTSGGSQASKGCGMIGATPNYVVNLANNFNYLRFTVQGAGQPTLLIQGPNGSSCVQAVPGGNIEVPGYWEKGSYSIYVGDRAGTQHPYTLTITQKR